MTPGTEIEATHSFEYPIWRMAICGRVVLLREYSGYKLFENETKSKEMNT
jgi:hypothetical protein